MPEDDQNSRLHKIAQRLQSDEPQDRPVPSKETLEELRTLFDRYADEIAADLELSQGSKTMYIDIAKCFVRWMYGGFRPGSRGGSLRSIRRLSSQARFLSKDVQQASLDGERPRA
jgi:hypothetical protein